jgi:hypothetical protein
MSISGVADRQLSAAARSSSRTPRGDWSCMWSWSWHRLGERKGAASSTVDTRHQTPASTRLGKGPICKSLCACVRVCSRDESVGAQAQASCSCATARQRLKERNAGTITASIRQVQPSTVETSLPTSIHVSSNHHRSIASHPSKAKVRAVSPMPAPNRAG